MKEKFKNYGLWVSIFAFIPLLLQSFNINVLPENYIEVTNSLLGILVLGGILSNPNSGTGYIDK
ncbi:holin [Clostridium lacusfryxellense]|uniref:holin n=1 Tax=Clostridium lacusfryxellense TaxID=205328 RepID=UPI001C0DA70B|nr:holin [Clostridium lacusfryxellense]MBU3112115.1 holin [Clostridium lacusfryxellense]